MTVFGTLYELALLIQTDPNLVALTAHFSPDRAVAERRLQASILENVMPGEGFQSSWQRVRVFCLNYINRAQAGVPEPIVRGLLASIERQHNADQARLDALAQISVEDLSGPRPQEFRSALQSLLSPTKFAELGGKTYLEWIEDRWRYWAGKSCQDLDADELVTDVTVLSSLRTTKIPGMGVPLAANFFADIGLAAFGKPDLHVMPIVSLLQLSIERGNEELDAFRGLIKLAKAEDIIRRNRGEFHWLDGHGGLMPRHLDRLIYLIGSDNFALTGHRKKMEHRNVAH